uniref:Methyltransferase HEMK2 n=1 Tax=Panagrellus redivivus TaxID=6233 RepID=A0A7E4V4B1_PANRE
MSKLDPKTPDHPRPLPKSVYDPAEDSFLLMDALVEDQEALIAQKPKVVFEIGVGSGVVSSFARTLIDGLLGNGSEYVHSFGTDINPEAIETAKRTATINKQSKPELFQCDLVSAVSPRFQGFIDVLLFNPPYVPTDDAPVTCSEHCWAGGPSGRGALDRLWPIVADLLSPTGSFYLVALKSNNIPDLIETAGQYNLDGKVVINRRCGIEHLFILKFWKK